MQRSNIIQKRLESTNKFSQKYWYYCYCMW